jgi:hypothetical protein
MTRDWRDIVEADLAELNARATATLDEEDEPEPPGSPPADSWVRAVRVDDDARATPAGPWHCVAGWDRALGDLSLRCSRRPGKPVSYGLRQYLGETPSWPFRSWERYSLLVAPRRPRGRLCRQCLARLAREQAAVAAELEAARVKRIMVAIPTIEAIATDTELDDAGRGRRLREVWPLM